MRRSSAASRAPRFLPCVLLLAAGLASAAPQPEEIPTPYVPSTPLAVDEMLRLADVKPGDLVVDLGSGDGRVVIAAARDYGARGLGIEIDAELVALSRRNAERSGVSDRVEFRRGDVLAADLSGASVVTLYLLPALVARLQPKLFAELAPGARIVAHDYGFPDWKPDRKVTISKTFYLYVVPARVAGRWRLAAALPGGERVYDLEFEQRYQEIRGGARIPGGFLPAFEARLAGERIAFVLVDGETSHRFEGRVSGPRMQGLVRSGPGRNPAVSEWHATRVPKAGA
jgi:SAM-dependent methyltransferase